MPGKESWMSRQFLAQTLVLAGFLGGFSATAGVAADRTGDRVSGWEQGIHDADAQIRAGEWKPARRALEKLLDEMTESLGDGPAASSLLGRVEALRSLAEAGLHEDRDALWDWNVAVTLLPALGTTDLSAYGEAGERLETARRAALPPADELPAGARPPAPRHPKRVTYPAARLRLCDPAPVEVAVTVGVDGLPRAPELDAEHAVVGVVTLEAMRAWKFDPAVQGGQPLDARFVLRTAWTKKVCRELLSAQRRGLPAEDLGEDELP
jgi:hypothetical protein